MTVNSLQMSESEIIEFISKRMRELFDVRKILLFGSRANGAGRPDSDFDVLVIVESDLPFMARQGVAIKALGRRKFAVDLLVYTPAEFKNAVAMPGSALFWADREGQVIYAK